MFAGGGLARLREHNCAAVMRALLEHGPLSRAQLVRLLGLAPSAMSYITGELIGAGLIEERQSSDSATGGTTQRGRGRQAVPLGLIRDARYVVAVHIGPGDLHVALVDLLASPVHVNSLVMDAARWGPDPVTLVAEVAARTRAADGACGRSGGGAAGRGCGGGRLGGRVAGGGAAPRPPGVGRRAARGAPGRGDGPARGGGRPGAGDRAGGGVVRRRTARRRVRAAVRRRHRGQQRDPRTAGAPRAQRSGGEGGRAAGGDLAGRGRPGDLGVGRSARGAGKPWRRPRPTWCSTGPGAGWR